MVPARVRAAAAFLAVAVCVVVPATSAVGAPAGHASGTAVQTTWGVAGAYPNRAALAKIRASGARVGLLELEWSSAEPRRGRIDVAYLRRMAAQARTMQSAGLSIVLETGIAQAPGWLLRMPGARFVNQWGQSHTSTPEPNLIWNVALRRYAEQYFRAVFRTLGTNFLAVRTGGGHWGELTYPREYVAGRVTNAYWAFDADARRSDPVPGWRPGDRSTHGQARAFLTWYLNQLAEYQDWQISALRASYGGTIAVLYPSWGMRSGDFTAAIRHNLDGSTSAEINGEIQDGTDHGRDVRALHDRRVALWCTWADATTEWSGDPSPMAELGALAKATHRQLMGENTGNAVSVAALNATRSNAIRYRASLILWVRYDDLGAPGAASLPDLAAATRR